MDSRYTVNSGFKNITINENKVANVMNYLKDALIVSYINSLTGACVGHGDPACGPVAQDEFFIVEGAAIDAGASGAVADRDIPQLNDKVLHHTMNLRRRFQKMINSILTFYGQTICVSGSW